jgi:cell wall-associated NlpC family hydrolase
LPPRPRSPSASSARAKLRARDEIVARAKAQVGDAYAYGGGGPDAFDCSGLTRFVFADLGLPHDSPGQASAGRPVDRSDLRPGDLVFFSTAGPGASHVGVATTADTVVSATNSGVMEHPIDDAYWGGAYVTARRVL